MLRLLPLLALLLLGAAWEPDRRATQDPSGAGQHETLIAVNPLDAGNAVVVVKDYRVAGVERNYLDTTTDGGLTWQEQPFPRPVPDLPTDTDPTVFFRRDGRAYLVWTSSRDFSSGGLFCAWSDDGGLTWTTPVAITPPQAHFDDKAWLAFDATGGSRDGTIYAAWTRFGNAEIVAARSTDGGATWGQTQIISNGASTLNNDGAQPLVLPDGSVIIVFLHDASPGQQGSLVLARSTDGGVSWLPNVPLFAIVQPPFTLPGENWRIFTYHSLAYDPVRGWLTVIWPDYRDGATEGINILLSRSTDQGATWTAPQRLNDDPPGQIRDQWFPALAAAPDGRLTALWRDRRADPANRLYHALARASTDGGLTWEPGTPVSSVPSDPNLNIPPGSEGIGDYIGLSAGPGVVWGAWTDVRNGDQDIYTARLRFTPQPLPSPTPTPIPTATATASPSPSACALQFNDVPPGSTFYAYVRCMACARIVGGYHCGVPGEPCHGAYYRPNANVTRGQTSKIVAEAAGFGEPVPSTQQTFADVPPSGTFRLWVERLSARGIIQGYPCGGPFEPCDPPANRPYFRPNNSVTRGQLAKITSGAAGWTETPTGQTFEDVPPGSPFYLYIERIAGRGIVSGYPCGGPFEPCLAPGNRPYFRPNHPATRGQMSRIAAEAFFPTCRQ
jgi:hypothetical protein